MSQERSISSDSLIDLRQSFYSLNLDQNSDQLNLNSLNLNENNSETNLSQIDQEENINSSIDLMATSFNNQTVYFHPSFLQLNSSPQSINAQEVNSIELNTLSNDDRPINNETTNQTIKENNSESATTAPPSQTTVNQISNSETIKNLSTRTPLNHKTSFQWDLYNDRNQVLNELRKKQKFIDIQLITDDGYSEFVHSTVISALGQGLAKCIFTLKNDPKTPCIVMNSDNESLKNHIKQIHLHGISGAVLKVIINCAYTGYIETDDKQIVWSILDIAERFSMNDLLRACCTYLIYQLNVDNCIKLLHLGIKFKHQLRTSSWNFIRLKFDRIVNECADYIHLSIDEVTKLLEDDHLNTVTGEQIVWTGICRWILSDLFNRTKYLNRLLEKLRFGRLPLDFIENVIAKEPLLIEIDNGVFNFTNGESNQTEKNEKINNKTTGVGGGGTSITNGSVNEEMINSINSTNEMIKSKNSKDTRSLELIKKSSNHENAQLLNFEDTKMPKVMSLIERMICIRKNRQNQYKTDNRNLLVDLNPYFVRPRVPAEVIFVIGGWQENMITTLIETYDVRTDMWLESHISLEYTRAYHGLEVLNGFLYIIGGTNGNKTLSSMHCFNPNNGKFE